MHGRKQVTAGECLYTIGALSVYYDFAVSNSTYLTVKEIVGKLIVSLKKFLCHYCIDRSGNCISTILCGLYNNNKYI